VPEPSTPLPLSVWPTAQQPAARQRAGRYLQASTAHPAKMLPAIARTAIQRYSQPGEIVLDPMCGIGTTLVEAAHLGRVALGVEREPRWAQLARANLAHATRQGATGTGTVITGDARALLDLVDPALHGQVALVVTSPPYGPSVHGQVDARPGGVVKYDNRYADAGAHARGNLARASDHALLDAMEQILASCLILLRPGGIVALTARPWRRRGLLVDFPAALIGAGERAGLVCFERNAALLVGLSGDRLVGRPSFFQLDRVRKARAAGVPLRVIAHEDLLVYRRPTGEQARRSGSHEPCSRQCRPPPTTRRQTGRSGPALADLEISSHPRRIRGVTVANRAPKGAANTRPARWEVAARRPVDPPRIRRVRLMADTAPSPGGRRATRRARRGDPPGFTFEIGYIGGAEGERLETVQLEAIREVLQWLHQTHTRPAKTPAASP
jgi:modification methylase